MTTTIVFLKPSIGYLHQEVTENHPTTPPPFKSHSIGKDQPETTFKLEHVADAGENAVWIYMQD